MNKPKFGKWKIIIAGSRDFNNYEFLRKKLNSVLKKIMDSKEEFEIVHGGARGVDFLGDKYAKKELRFKLGNGIRKFPAQWSVYGKGAGMVRNKEMAEYATHLIAFWDGKSPGTKDMIKQAKLFNLIIRVIRIDRKE